MKLGGSVTGSRKTAEEWERLLKASRFAAITCPVDSRTDKALAREVLDAARAMGVTVAEAGVWKNVLSIDKKERESALLYAKNQLAFADEHQIPCCVNIAGTRGTRWDGAFQDNYSEEVYSLIIETVQDIIDSVQPKTAFYTLEPMPWMLPDGPDEYLRLVKDINRPQFAVHMDFVNMINSPRRSLSAHEFIEECFMKLGSLVKSCHLKDSLMEENYTAVIREMAPGRGRLDFTRVLSSIDRHLAKGAPVLLEHMNTSEEYAAAYDHVSMAAQAAGIPIR